MSLMNIDEKNKLLRLVTILPNGGGMKFSLTYHRRFTRPDDEWASDSYRRFRSALETEIQKYRMR